MFSGYRALWCAAAGLAARSEARTDRPGERAQRPKAALEPEEGKFSPTVIACSQSAVIRPMVWLSLS